MLVYSIYYNRTIRSKSMTYSAEIKKRAKEMWLQHFDAHEIQKELALNSVRIVYMWAKNESWDALLEGETVIAATTRRLLRLVDLPEKNDSQLREIEILGELLIKAEKAEVIKTGGGKVLQSGQHSGGGKKKKFQKNDISMLAASDFDRVADELFFAYQKKWREIGKNPNIRDRWILKSRQIGATFFFAFEALEKAVITGKNQIFMSASRRQAEVFRGYIIALARKYFEIELTGNPIVLNNDAQLIFLSTNVATAQSEHGDLYFDEAMWTRNFDEIYEVASPMASQKMYTTTTFSTPSTVSHQAYKYFSGEKRNEGRPKDEKITLDVSHKALKNGRYDDGDKTWRQIVTIYDAQEQGCDLFDIEYLKAKYTPARFDNLFGCQFIDDSNSVFDLNELLNCATDSAEWRGFKKDADRPYGNRGVLVGYDPSRSSRDKAEIVALSQPQTPLEPFRLLERVSMNEATAEQQVSVIRLWHERKYNVVFIGVDKSGPGIFVWDNVMEIFPNATPIIYSPEMKTRLVEKARAIISSRRFEYDADEIDVPLAFLSIRQTSTQNGQITYVADRSDAVGHGDVAWAVMHAMISEPLAVSTQRKTSITIAH